MRSPDRIPDVLEVLEDYWTMYPDMRLGQLLWEIAGEDPFHIEDDILVQLMEKEL